MNRFTLLILAFTLLTVTLSCQSAAQFTKATSVSGQSVTTAKLRFPERWSADSEYGVVSLSYVRQLEVRKVPNSSEFFFAAVANDDEFVMYPKIRKREYSKNLFAVNVADTPRLRVATEGEWEGASRIVSGPRTISATGPDDSREMEYRGKKYQKVGQYWGEGMLSPRGKWLAIFSYSGVKRPPDILFGGNDVPFGDAYWEVYDTVTGEKVFAWQATNVRSPDTLYRPIIWLEERYFLFPEDLKAQSFVVVTLPTFVPEPNGVTVRLPSRKDDQGNSIPAPFTNEAWTPLIPLTKEQAARITAPTPTDFTEVRLSAQQSPRELLLAIQEETENRDVNRQARDGSGDYNYRLFSTYYYAVPLDNPTQARFATKEEWQRARVVRSSRNQVKLVEELLTMGSEDPSYRPFPKTGASRGSPQALTAGQWVAVFSYTQQAGANSEGKIFVDVFERLPGDKFLSTEIPFTGSANALFNLALWIEEGYVIVPLNTSLDSFVLWNLPGGHS